MNYAPTVRDGNVIFTELYALTSQMVEQRHNSDFLTQSVDKRQELMDEYGRWAAANPDIKEQFENDPRTAQTITKILAMDKVICKALDGFKAAAQNDVANSNNQRKVLGYLGNAISASGSYMDYKK